jgi:tRNA A37 threonylcarbamoyladenosine dehydratase
VQALPSTVGKPKAAVLRDRLAAINPSCRVEAFEAVFSKDTAELFDMEGADYVIDAIDSLSFKLDLIETCFEKNVKLAASMGMARKLDPARIQVADIWDTHGCPLARLVRQGLRKRLFTGHFPAVYSDEHLPQAVEETEEWHGTRKAVNGSCVTVTASAGFTLAALALRAISAQ